MTDKFKNKYRISSTRLQNWDYGWNAAYFVTICTKNKHHYFGDIAPPVETPDSGVSTPTTNLPPPTMQLSSIGKITQQYWHEIPEHFPFVKLSSFVVMPNHVHGIVIINKPDDPVGAPDDPVETPESGVSTPTNENETTTATKNNTGGTNDKWKPGTLGVIINQYKRIVTITARKTNPDFAWQTRFHDHIIRNEKSFLNISEYIQANPLRWQEDKYYA